MIIKKCSFILIKILIVSLSLAACTETVGKKPSNKEVSSFDVSPTSVEVSGLNQILTLSARAFDANGQEIASLDDLSWKSSNESIATVSTTGEVLSLSTGTVSITASYKKLEFSSVVTITQSGKSISGVAQYKDKLYHATNGFAAGSEFKKIRFAEIQLLTENGDLLDTTATDENGYYIFSKFVPNKFSIRLLSKINASPASGFRVRDMSSNTYSFTLSSVGFNLDYPFSMTNSTAAGVFNLLDIALISATYSQDVLSQNVENLDMFWQTGNNLGTYYCSGLDSFECINGRGIYILNQTPSASNDGVPDTDEFDDDVIFHEFGHFLTEKYARDDSIGGVHFITQNDVDLRLSWSEGWSTFFPFAVKTWLQSSRSSLLSTQSAITTNIDTIGATYVQLAHDISTSEMGDSYYYASSEAAVSRILWNMHQTFGMVRIWDVIINYFPSSNKPTSLPVFWDGLLSSSMYDSSQLVALSDVFSDRNVDYKLDASEGDDSMISATSQSVDVVSSVSNTLYSANAANDKDYFSFTAIAGKVYKITTTDLRNGIDTSIRLLDENGNLLDFNDDADSTAYILRETDGSFIRYINDTTAMSSELQYAITVSGQYFVEVTFADKLNDTFDFVGHYGSYKLLISEVN